MTTKSSIHAPIEPMRMAESPGTLAWDPVASVVVLKVRGPLEIEQLGIAQDFDGSIALPAVEARCHGDQVKYESGHERDNIGFWMNPDEWVDWEVKITKPGRFDVSAEIAAPDAASFEVTAAGQSVSGKARVTGDYGKFRVTKVGQLEIGTAGKISIAVKPVKDGWRPINLKSVRLKPVSQTN